MKYRITITHGSYNPSPFDFDAVSARDAVREVAADGDWEPYETITIEADDGKTIERFEVDTKPEYWPRFMSSRQKD
jgi:hypothetical protein